MQFGLLGDDYVAPLDDLTMQRRNVSTIYCREPPQTVGNGLELFSLYFTLQKLVQGFVVRKLDSRMPSQVGAAAISGFCELVKLPNSGPGGPIVGDVPCMPKIL
jgi:hypothetical protein